MNYCMNTTFEIVRMGRTSIVPKLYFSEDGIIYCVCNHFKISEEDIKGKSRKNSVVMARYTAIYLLKHYRANISNTKIGRIFNRDHSSIIYALTQVNDWIKYDKKYRRHFMAVEQKVREAGYHEN